MENWSEIIKSVKSVQGLIALSLLILNGIILFLIQDAAPESKPYLIGGVLFLMFVTILIIPFIHRKTDTDTESGLSKKLDGKIQHILDMAREEAGPLDNFSIKCQINPILDAIDVAYDNASSSTVIKTLDLDILRWKLDSETKNKYFDIKNKNALSRGVVIRRIFTLDDELLSNDDTYRLELIPKIIEGHVEAGVQARVIAYSELLDDEANEDFIIMGEFLAIESFYRPGSSRNSGIVSRGEGRISRYNERFDSIWARARDVNASNVRMAINDLRKLG